jgi:hypothetical protein
MVLLLGAVLGWLLHGNRKKKLTKIMKDYSQQINSFEKERDELTTKIQQNERLNSENKRLLSRLSSMEKGANLASHVLKENKAKLDDAEQNLAKMQQLMEQRDDTVHTAASSLLVLKNQENQELRVELHDFLEKLELAERKSIDNELRTKEIVNLYNNYVADSKIFKLQVMQSIDKLRSSLKNKHTQCESLKKEVEFAQEELKKKLATSRKKEIVILDEIEIIQALLEAHEQGNQD